MNDLTAAIDLYSGLFGGDTEPCPTKSRGRPRDEAIRAALYGIVREAQPATVRQVFYLAMVRKLVSKTEAGYKKVVRLLSSMRLEGTLPWGWIEDGTRWMHGAQTYDGVGDAAAWWASQYRRDLIPALGRIEVWLEKDALAGVILPATNEYAVPLFPCRGYPSLSFIHSSAMSWPEDGEVHVYYLGDHDPSGKDMDRNLEERMRQFAPTVDLTFERLAVTEEQIEDWDLPGRPTKAGDTRAASWDGGDSVELDAIEPDQLRELVTEAIEQHVDQEQLDRILAVEEAERESIATFGQWRDNLDSGISVIELGPVQ